MKHKITRSGHAEGVFLEYASTCAASGTRGVADRWDPPVCFQTRERERSVGAVAHRRPFVGVEGAAVLREGWVGTTR